MQVGDFSCLELDVRAGMRAVVGRDGGDGVSMFDLATGRAVATVRWNCSLTTLHASAVLVDCASLLRIDNSAVQQCCG